MKHRPVGAGLPAMAIFQATAMSTLDRNRQQAGSYGLWGVFQD
ncbi:hypothetical protein [Pseudomonas gingeri]|nr:hypothetical protein [Pseudomonas gingeri]